MIESWPETGTRKIGDFRIFSLHASQRVSPRTGSEHEFLVLHCRDWVNVVAITENEELIMVEQYRHGSKTVELEVPGGVMDAEDTSPVVAGVRELREETGYAGDDAQIIGGVYANPAIQNNTCFTVLVNNCRLVHDTEFDHGEDIITRLIPLADIPGMVAAGRIKHSLVVVALYYYDLWKRGAGE